MSQIDYDHQISHACLSSIYWSTRLQNDYYDGCIRREIIFYFPKLPSHKKRIWFMRDFFLLHLYHLKWPKLIVLATPSAIDVIK